MKVLVVEDNEVNVKVMKAILKRNQIDSDYAEHGLQALEIIKDNKVDIIFMDCQMPVLDGYETTKAIREIEQQQQLKRCPIIALTANAMSGDKEKCLNVGMDDFLAKPFQGVQIMEIISKWRQAG